MFLLAEALFELVSDLLEMISQVLELVFEHFHAFSANLFFFPIKVKLEDFFLCFNRFFDVLHDEFFLIFSCVNELLHCALQVIRFGELFCHVDNLLSEELLNAR